MGSSIGTLFPLRWRLWLGRLLFKPLGRSTTRLSWHRVIKGPCSPPEVEAMKYVASHTDVPIPKIHAIHLQKHPTRAEKKLIYIEMDYVPGDTLETAWEHLTWEQRSSVMTDLKQHVSALRKLSPPAEHIVSSALQNPAYDCRIGFRFYGPFNLQEFHSLARGHCPQELIAGLFGEEVQKVHVNNTYRTCFTHADIAPRNISTRNGRLVAIIDWGFSGWFPEYWEYTKAKYNPFWGEGWEELLDSALPVYETELNAEKTLWKMVPEPGSEVYYYHQGKESKQEGSAPSVAWLDARSGQPPDLWSSALI